jgi:hypothetical protein
VNGLLEPSDFKLVPDAKRGVWEPFEGADQALEEIRDGIAALEIVQEDPMQVDPDALVPVAAILNRAVSHLRMNGRMQEAQVLRAILPGEDHDNLRRE